MGDAGDDTTEEDADRDEWLRVGEGDGPEDGERWRVAEVGLAWDPPSVEPGIMDPPLRANDAEESSTWCPLNRFRLDAIVDSVAPGMPLLVREWSY